MTLSGISLFPVSIWPLIERPRKRIFDKAQLTEVRRFIENALAQLDTDTMGPERSFSRRAVGYEMEGAEIIVIGNLAAFFEEWEPGRMVSSVHRELIYKLCVQQIKETVCALLADTASSELRRLVLKHVRVSMEKMIGQVDYESAVVGDVMHALNK